MTAGRLQIIEPMAVTAINTSGSHASQTNLITDDPKEVFAPGVATAVGMEFDLGAAANVDSVFVGFTNATAAATAALSSLTAFGGTGAVVRVAATTIRAADAKSALSAILLRLAAPISSRYWRVDLSANGGVNWQIGRVVIGLAFEASWDREWGGGRRPIDTAKVTPLNSGGFGVQPGARKAAYDWTFGDLTDAELEQLWGIVYRVGNSSPVVVCEHDAIALARNERLHYGLLQRLDKFERRDPQATKWQLEIEGWI